jgi:hypothetical protein
MASNALHIALERHSKLKAIYNGELFRIELLDIKRQACPLENPECTVAREEAYEVVAMLRVMHIIPRDAASVD